MVSENLNAHLTMDQLTYEFPYGLRAKNAALVTTDDKGQAVDLIRVADLELVLAKLPLGDGPLVIERINAKRPAGRLVMEDGGLVGGKRLVKKDEDDEEETAPPVPQQPNKPARKPKVKKEKPSDYFRLRKLEIEDGQIAFEDRRGGAELPETVWTNLAVDLNITPTSGSLYSYEFAARNVPLAVTNAHGSFDVDELKLNVDRFVMALTVEHGKPQKQLPPRLQYVLNEYDVAGGLTLMGSAQIPLKDPEQASYDASLDLPAASVRVSESGKFDHMVLKLHVSSQDKEEAAREIERPIVASTQEIKATQPTTRATSRPARQPATLVKLDLLEIGAGDTLLHIEKGEVLVDPSHDLWRVKNLLCRLDLGKSRKGLPGAVDKALEKFELSGKMKLTATGSGPLHPIAGKRLIDQLDYQVIAYPRDIEVKPAKWSSPLTEVSGTVRINPLAIMVENAEANFHGDKFLVSSARIPLENIENEIRVQDIAGSALLTGKVEDYPRAFEFIAKQIHPSGTFYAMGQYSRKNGLRPDEKPDYRFNIRTDGAVAILTPRQVPVTNIKAEIVAVTRLVDIKRVEGSAFGGTVTGEGQVTPGKGKDLIYQGSLWLRDLDLQTLAPYVSTDKQKVSRLVGKGNLNVQFQGTGADDKREIIDNFSAKGKFEALEGDFWSVPVIDEITGNTKVARTALTAGQAVAVFEIHDQIVDLKQAAISSPILGVQGSGTIGFDGSLKLTAVAAPLADWKDQLKRTKIPIISDVAGEALGGLQKIINGASQTLLYEFRVTGTTKQPKIETVPAPVLTEGVAKLFGSMVKGEKWDQSFGGGSDDRGK